MDKFEKLIKDSLEGHEMPFNPQAWDNVSNELGDSFDQMMKDSTSSYEAPYNPAAWDAVNHQLGPAYSAWKWIGGSAAVIAIVAGGSYLIDNSESGENQLTNYESNEVVINDNNENVEDTYFVNEENSDENVSNNDNNVVDNDVISNENVLQEIDPDLSNGVNNNNSNSNDPDLNLNNGVDLSNVDNGNDNDQATNNDSNDNNSNNSNNDNDVSNFKANAKFSITKDNVYISEVCQGEDCIFKPEQIENDLVYVWNYGDGSISSSTLGKHKYRKSGEFTVTLEVKDPRTDKTVGTSSETIVVNELPQVKFSWDQEYAGIPTVKFSNESFDEKVVNWNIIGLKQSANPDFEYTFRKKGKYKVKLTAVNDFGCLGSKSKEISIEKDYNLLAPASFTPNDANGVNDNFIPAALTVMDVPFTMTIQDKSGKLVYRTQNAFEPWDGRFTEDNIMAPPGSAYIWRVILTNKNGEQELYEGQVIVI